MSAYLLLFPELHLHLFVTRLVLADAVAGDEVAANVSEFWVLFPRLFDQTEEDTSVRNSVFNRVLVLVKLGLQHRGFMPLCTSRVCVPELWEWIIARPILWCYTAFNHRPSGHRMSLFHHFIMFDIYMLNHILIILWILELRPNMCFVRSKWSWPLTTKFYSVHPLVIVYICTKFEEIPSRRSWDFAHE